LRIPKQLTDFSTEMTLFEKLTEKARGQRQRIVLPEGTEPRTLKAADRIIADNIADIILIGNNDEIKRMATDMGLEQISRATIVDPSDNHVIDRYAPLLYELRRHKGMTEEQSRLTAANPLYLGCLMVKAGDADGEVAGAQNTTGNVLRAAFQVIKTRPGISVVSGAFLMLLPEDSPFGTDGVIVFADCAVLPDPNSRGAGPDRSLLGRYGPRAGLDRAPRGHAVVLDQGLG